MITLLGLRWQHYHQQSRTYPSKKFQSILLDLLHNYASVDFGVLLSRVFDSFCGGCIKLRILPPQKESKIGQNNPQNRRSLSYARGLIWWIRTAGLTRPSWTYACPIFLFPYPKLALTRLACQAERRALIWHQRAELRTFARRRLSYEVFLFFSALVSKE